LEHGVVTKFKVIDTQPGGPPRPLGLAGQALWHSITRDYDISDAAGIELLCLACQALDRAEECRSLIDRHGVAQVHRDTGVIRQNPLLRDELANRAFCSKTLERLGLNTEPVKAAGRPTGGTYSFDPQTPKQAS
jgi:hypothetical protein